MIGGLLSSNLLSQNAISGEPAYTSKVYLYNAGNECTDVTGGWTSTGYTQAPAYIKVDLTKNASDIQIYRTGTYGHVVGGTVNTIDFTNHTKLTVTGYATALPPGSVPGIICRTSILWTSGSTLFESDLTSTTGDFTLELDITSVNSSGYVLLQGASDNGETQNVKVYTITLE